MRVLNVIFFIPITFNTPIKPCFSIINILLQFNHKLLIETKVNKLLTKDIKDYKFNPHKQISNL